MFKGIFWITFLCVFIHYADKIAYNEQRLSYKSCVKLLGENSCERQVPLPPLERFFTWVEGN